MKKIIKSISIATLLIVVIGSCKKGTDNNQSMQIEEKFFETTAKTKPVVKKLVQYIHDTKKFGNIETFVKKYGYPNWDRAIIKSKSSATYSIESNETEEYVLAPTVNANGENLLGFIAAEVTTSTVVCTAYLGSDYKGFAYESSNPSGVSAENIVNVMMSLEHDLYGISTFRITDPLLQSFNAIQNGEVPLVSIEEGSNLNLGSGCVYRKVINIVDGQMTDLTTWSPLYCTIDQLANFSGNVNTNNSENGYDNYQVISLGSSSNFLSEEEVEQELYEIELFARQKHIEKACDATPDDGKNGPDGTLCEDGLGKCRKNRKCKHVTTLTYFTDFSRNEVKNTIELLENSSNIRFTYSIN